MWLLVILLAEVVQGEIRVDVLEEYQTKAVCEQARQVYQHTIVDKAKHSEQYVLLCIKRVLQQAKLVPEGVQ